MKSLICITTCKRVDYLKMIIFPFVAHCNASDKYDFLLAQDGNESEYAVFCDQYNIPMIYSDEREGVGISKNRVLSMFPDYDFYFFIEDDVELLDGSVFDDFIKVYAKTGFPHMSINFLRDVIKNEIIGEYELQFAYWGGAQFNFFAGTGLKKVGGWHGLFAQYKRYGHTEHTYRFFYQGLQPSPFIAITNINQKLMLHNPPHVSVESGNVNDRTQLIEDEEKLIEQKSCFQPVTTFSPLYFNGYDMSFNKAVDEFLAKSRKHYPLTVGKPRRIAMAEYYFEMFRRKHGFLRRLKFLFLSLINYPLNNSFKHFLKMKLKKTI